MKDFSLTPEISIDVVQQKVAEIATNKLSYISENEVNKFMLSIIDLTTLEGGDTNKKVSELCIKALSFRDDERAIPSVAAICVYPVFVKQVKEALAGSGIRTASVAGAFPSGQSPINIKLDEVKYAIEEGADEIDMVISRGKFLEGEYTLIFDEIAAIKERCGNAHLKVILETGELLTPTNIRRASEIAMAAGADFIKTSTGKITPAATPEAMLVMVEAIRDFYVNTNKKVGIKAAGGISAIDTAMTYVKLAESVLGKEWMSSEYFRIGASRLADVVYEKCRNAS